MGGRPTSTGASASGSRSHVGPGADHAGIEADRAEAAEEARVLELHAGVDHHLQDGGVQLCHEVQQQSLRIKKVWADGS